MWIITYYDILNKSEVRQKRTIFIKKLQIPYGFYCYTTLKIIPDEKFGVKMKTKECSFYQHILGLDGFCYLEKCEITDQCKVCGVHEFTDKQIESFGKEIESRRKSFIK